MLNISSKFSQGKKMVLRNPKIAKLLVFNFMENKLRILDAGVESYEAFSIYRSVHWTSICWIIIIIIFSVWKQTLLWHSGWGEHLHLHIYIYTPKVILLLCKLVSSSQDWLIISYSIKFGESYIAVFFFFGPLGRQFILGIQFGSIQWWNIKRYTISDWANGYLVDEPVGTRASDYAFFIVSPTFYDKLLNMLWFLSLDWLLYWI